jgi:hypothetical protein
MGWFGNIFLVIGLWKIGNRERRAFAFSIVGELIWLAHSCRLGRWDMGFICVVFALMAARGWWRWRPGTGGEVAS